MVGIHLLQYEALIFFEHSWLILILCLTNHTHFNLYVSKGASASVCTLDKRQVRTNKCKCTFLEEALPPQLRLLWPKFQALLDSLTLLS